MFILSIVLVIFFIIFIVIVCIWFYNYLVFLNDKVRRLICEIILGWKFKIIEDLEVRFFIVSKNLEEVNIVVLVDGIYS